jgi:hypothetical protein
VVADIARESQAATSFAFYFLTKLGERVGVSARDDQVRPRIGEGAGEDLTKAAAATGDQGDAAAEIELL